MFIECLGYNLYYERAGKGTPILLLHGWGVDSTYFKNLRDALILLEYDVITLDWPGFGQSPTPSNVIGVSEYSSILSNFISALQIRNALIFGHSFGGQVAAFYASQDDMPLKALIVCEAAIIRRKKSLKARSIGTIVQPVKWIFTVPILRQFSSFFRSVLYAMLGTKDYYHAQGIMKQVFLKIIQEDILHRVPNITAPTLIIWGFLDRSTPVKDVKIIRSQLFHSTYVEVEIFPNIGHSLPREKGAELAARIDAFNKRLP